MSNAPEDRDQVPCLRCPDSNLRWFSDISRLKYDRPRVPSETHHADRRLCVPSEHIKRTHGPDRLCPNCVTVFEPGSRMKLDTFKKAHKCSDRPATPREAEVRRHCLSSEEYANYRNWVAYKTYPALDGALFHSFRAIQAALGSPVPEGSMCTEF